MKVSTLHNYISSNVKCALANNFKNCNFSYSINHTVLNIIQKFSVFELLGFQVSCPNNCALYAVFLKCLL